MNRTRVLILQSTAAAALLVVAAGWVVYGLGGRQAALLAREKDISSRIEGVSRGSVPTQQALERITAAREDYAARLASLEKLLIKPDKKYLVEGKDDPANYFMQMLVSLREACRKEGGPTFEGTSPLGFTPELKKKSEGEGNPERLALLRLAAVERLLWALRKAGTPHVVSIEHLTPRAAFRLDGICEGAVVLPIQVRFAATEKAAAAFLQAITAPDTAAELEQLELEATSEYEGITVSATLGYFFLGASDILPEKAEGPALAPTRRW